MRYGRWRPFGADPGERAALLAYAADGTTAEVCREFGVCRATAVLGFRRAGVGPRRHGAAPDPMIRARVLGALTAGCVNGPQVARALGYRSRHGVARVIRELRADGLVRTVGTGRYAVTTVTEKWRYDAPREA